MRSLRGWDCVERGENAKGRRERREITPSRRIFGLFPLFWVVSGSNGEAGRRKGMENEGKKGGEKSGEGRGRGNREKK